MAFGPHLSFYRIDPLLKPLRGLRMLYRSPLRGAHAEHFLLEGRTLLRGRDVKQHVVSRESLLVGEVRGCVHPLLRCVALLLGHVIMRLVVSRALLLGRVGKRSRHVWAY